MKQAGFINHLDAEDPSTLVQPRLNIVLPRLEHFLKFLRVTEVDRSGAVIPGGLEIAYRANLGLEPLPLDCY